MTQEDKDLLIKDLCARLPYEVICDNGITIGKLCGFDIDVLINKKSICIKPYLRPMSSMTEEEEREVQILWNVDFYDKNSWYHCYPRTADFYHSHHFDYRGLIKKGLALEAPKDMYKF